MSWYRTMNWGLSRTILRSHTGPQFALLAGHALGFLPCSHHCIEVAAGGFRNPEYEFCAAGLYSAGEANTPERRTAILAASYDISSSSPATQDR